MIKPYPRIISFTILIIYFEKYMDGILKLLHFRHDGVKSIEYV